MRQLAQETYKGKEIKIYEEAHDEQVIYVDDRNVTHQIGMLGVDPQTLIYFVKEQIDDHRI